MKTNQFFSALLLLANMNIFASDGDQKSVAQSLHEDVARTISIDMSFAVGWGEITEFPEYLKDRSQAEYSAQIAPYTAIKEFYQKEFASTDPDLKNTEFLLVNYSYNLDADLKEFQAQLPSKNARSLIYAYAAPIEDPLKLPRVVPLSVFRPHEATCDNAGNLLTHDVFRNHGDIVHIATEQGPIPMKIVLNDSHDRSIAGALAYQGNRPFLRLHFGGATFEKVATALRTNPENLDIISGGYAHEILKRIPRFQPLVCPDDYSASDDHTYINEILMTNKTLTEELYLNRGI